MTKLEEITQKLQRRDAEIDIKLEVANSVLPLREALQDKIKTQVVGNNTLVVKEVCNSIVESIQSQTFDAVVQAIENQTEALQDDTSKLVLSELKLMLQELQKLENKPYFDEQKFNDVFNTSINRVVTVLQNQQELPYQTIYNRNSKGQITAVTEYFAGYTVKNTWSYDQNGRLIKVTTEKNANT